MQKYSLSLPEGFDEYAPEVESKGWFAEARLIVQGKKHRVSFYDATRLHQEVESEFQRGGVFFEPNLVVVPAVTRKNMEKAIDILVRSGGVASLAAE